MITNVINETLSLANIWKKGGEVVEAEEKKDDSPKLKYLPVEMSVGEKIYRPVTKDGAWAKVNAHVKKGVEENKVEGASMTCYRRHGKLVMGDNANGVGCGVFCYKPFSLSTYIGFEVIKTYDHNKTCIVVPIEVEKEEVDEHQKFMLENNIAGTIMEVVEDVKNILSTPSPLSEVLIEEMVTAVEEHLTTEDGEPRMDEKSFSLALSIVLSHSKRAARKREYLLKNLLALAFEEGEEKTMYKDLNKIIDELKKEKKGMDESIGVGRISI